MPSPYNIKRIENLSTAEQYVVLAGHKVVLAPGEQRDFEADLAALFIARCAPKVREVPDIGGTVAPLTTARTIWLANMTGNPDAPLEVASKKVEKGRWVDCQIPNPKREPQVLRATQKGGQRFVSTNFGMTTSLNLLGTEVVIPPYKRIEVDYDLGNWFLGRDSSGELPSRGKVIRSRAPSEFEPNMSWSLDDMRAYLSILDESAKVGPSEAQIRASTKFKAREKDTKEDAERKQNGMLQALREAKERTLKQLHFRVADPQYRLPSRIEFESFKAGRDLTPVAEAAEVDPTWLLDEADQNTAAAGA